MQPERQDFILHLFEDYMDMHASRDELLIARFSDNFGGYTGGGNFLSQLPQLPQLSQVQRHKGKAAIHTIRDIAQGLCLPG